jgi:LysR family transcriptional regulator, low CO2-responsive transcriptional regulator
LIQATLHQLAVFEAVARHGSFTRAAEELFITQPSVSSQIKHLTQAVGLPLFEQIGKRLYLTEAGTELLATCQDIFARLNNFEMKVADLKGTKQGQLSLAVITTAKYFIPRLLGSFCQKYPGVDVSLQVTNHHQISRRMLENQDDLYIVSQPPEEIDLCSQPFLDNPLVVLAPINHPLVGQKNIPIQKLNDEPFIMREPGSGTRVAVQHLFAKQKVSVKVKLELGSNEAIKQAIAGGLGLSALSQHCLISEASNEIAVLDVQHFPIMRRWYATYLAGKQLSVIAQTFLDYLLVESQKHPVLRIENLPQPIKC